MAGEMEHISSTELIDRLDAFMGYPQRDPHGDPIPDCDGNIKADNLQPLSTLSKNACGIISGVCDHASPFLRYLEQNELTLGQKVTVTEVIEYDNSRVLKVKNKTIQISQEVAGNLLIAL